MAKAAKMVIGSVIAIAAPVFAPVLFAAAAGSTALGGMLAAAANAVGTTIGSGFIGAAGGALGAELQDKNIGAGAAGGLFGGLLSGYGAAKAADVKSLMGTMAKTGMDKVANPVWGQAAGSVAAPVAAAPGAVPAALSVAQPAGIASGFNYIDSVAAPQATAGLNVPNSPLASPSALRMNPTDFAASTGQIPMAPQSVAGPLSPLGVSNYAPTTTLDVPKTLGERLAEAGRTTWDKATTPEALARTGGRLATYVGSSALAGSGMTGEEERMMRQQAAEARRTQELNRAADAVRFDQGMKAIYEADAMDPHHRGLVSARGQQLAGARAKQEGLRGLDTRAASSVGRRYDLGTSRATGSAYDTGFMAADAMRTQRRQAGVSMLPTSYTNTDWASLYGPRNTAYQRQRDVRSDIGKLIGDTWFNDTRTGDEDEEDKKKGK